VAFKQPVCGAPTWFDEAGCGHIPPPVMREIDGTFYCNHGDWVESCSALVEHHDGRLELVD